MANGYVAIVSPVDQHYWNLGVCHYRFRRNLLEVHLVLPSGIAECELDNWAEDGSPEPWASIEELPNTIIGNLPETRKRRFSSNSAKVGFGLKRLKELSRSHGLRKAEDATRVLVLLEPIKPAVNVLRFQQTVGGKFAAAGPVRPSIGHEDAEAVTQEEFRVANHTQPIVTETVQQDDGCPVAAPGPDSPGAQGCSVAGRDMNVGHLGVMAMGHFFCLHLVFGG